MNLRFMPRPRLWSYVSTPNQRLDGDPRSEQPRQLHVQWLDSVRLELPEFAS